MEGAVENDQFNPAYIGKRLDIVRLVPADVVTVLDMGCSTGAVGGAIKRNNPGAEVIGIELEESMATEARKVLDRVIVADLNQLDIELELQESYFDCILLADVLEHLVDPWRVLKALKRCLKPAGVIVASIPNVRHIDTLFNLAIRGRWPYRERGIHDRTHLRFFTLKNIEELFSEAGLQIKCIRNNYRILERPHPYNRYAKFLAFWPVREFFVFQYLIQAHKIL